MKYGIGENRWIEIIEGDITDVEADAIVNAANSGLVGGGGVDGAIHWAGGPSLMRELDEIRGRERGCATGSAVVTGAGRLKARFVFHAVGPVYRDGAHGEAVLLRSCYATCLRLAEERGLTRIAFPAISTGVYGYPLEAAAEIALDEVRKHLEIEAHGLREVIFVLYDAAMYQIHERLLLRWK